MISIEFIFIYCFVLITLYDKSYICFIALSINNLNKYVVIENSAIYNRTENVFTKGMYVYVGLHLQLNKYVVYIKYDSS